MQDFDSTALTATFLVLCASSKCGYGHDSVAPGYYGEMGSDCAATSSDSGARATATSIPTVGRSLSSGAAMGGTKAPLAMSTAGTTNIAAGAAAPGRAKGNAQCDMTGKWLVTVHKVTDGLGNLQTVHEYYYYELTQNDAAFSVTRSLKCGSDAVGGGTFAVTVDFKNAMEGVMKHTTHNGRTRKSVGVNGGCQVDIDEQYTVVGATVPYYLDPSTTLPSVEQMATGDSPGWEDWDGDGNPGVTGICNGAASGKIFVAARDWATFSGNVPEIGAVLKLSVNWKQEPNVMASEGSPFLTTEVARAADSSLHFVQLARLSDDLTSGEDLALCKQLIELAPTLTPEAATL